LDHYSRGGYIVLMIAGIDVGITTTKIAFWTAGPPRFLPGRRPGTMRWPGVARWAALRARGLPS
jgi:hypothetical protein